LRANLISWGGILAVFVPSLLWFADLQDAQKIVASGERDGRQPSSWFAEGEYLLAVMQGVLAVWIPLCIGAACGRERESGCLQTFSSSGLSAGKLILGLVVGPALVELVWAALLGPVLVALRWVSGTDWLSMARMQTTGLAGVVCASLFVISSQCPRPRRSTGHSVAPVLTFLWFWTTTLVLLERLRLAPPGTFGVPFPYDCVGLAMASVLLYSHAAGLLKLHGAGLRTGSPRFAIPPILALFAGWLHSYGASKNILGPILGIGYSFSVMVALLLFWETRSYPGSPWNIPRLALASALSLTATAFCGVLAIPPHGTNLSATSLFLLGLVVAVLITRLLGYLLFAGWLSRRLVTWQTLAMVLLFGLLELFGYQPSVWLKAGGFTEAEAVGRVVSGFKLVDETTQLISSGSDVSLRLTSSYWAPALVTIAAVAVLAIAVRHVAGTERGSELALNQTGLASTSAGTAWMMRPRFTGPFAALARPLSHLSPLLAALLLHGVRRISITGVLPKVLGAIALLWLPAHLPLAANPSHMLVTAIEINRYTNIIISFQFLVCLGSLINLDIMLRHERKSQLMQQHVYSGMSAWQVALGYALGASFSALALIVAIAGMALLAGKRWHVFTPMANAQLVCVSLSLWLTLFVAVHECRPVRREARLVLFSLCLLCVPAFLHVFAGALSDFAPANAGHREPPPAAAKAEAPASKLLLERPSLLDPRFLPVGCGAMVIGSVVLFGVLTRRLGAIAGRPASRWILIGVPTLAVVAARFYPSEGHGRMSATLATGFGAAAAISYYAWKGREITALSSGARVEDSSIRRDLILFLGFTVVTAISGVSTALRAKVSWLTLSFIAALVVGTAFRGLCYNRLFRAIKERSPGFLLFGASATYTILEVVPIIVLLWAAGWLPSFNRVVTNPGFDRQTGSFVLTSLSTLGQIVFVFRSVISLAVTGGSVDAASPGGVLSAFRSVPLQILMMVLIVFVPNLLLSLGLCALSGRGRSRRVRPRASSGAVT
jgi:hypothetical protein